MNSAPSTPLLPARLAGLVGRLPQWPPSTVLCAGLNLLFLPTLDAETKQRLMGRTVAIQVSDAGLDCRVSLTALGFLPAFRNTPEVTIRACAWDYYRLARRLEDPDTLFFSRRLTIEGDTELGLLVKNLLDAMDWSHLPGPLGPSDREAAPSRRTPRHAPQALPIKFPVAAIPRAAQECDDRASVLGSRPRATFRCRRFSQRRAALAASISATASACISGWRAISPNR